MFKSPLPLLCVVATAVFSFSACAGPQSEFLVDPGAVGPYSSGVIVGDMVMLSGKIGAERDGTFEREVETCIDAIAAELAGLDLDLGDVVEARVYLTDMARYGDFNAIYGARFSKPYPARTCVAVKELPVGARVEIQVVARR
jgi:2-iminobutanoate/2-iminopropanoate deaminase